MSELQLQAARAREAWRVLAVTSTEIKNNALHQMADCLLAAEAEILSANAADIAAALEDVDTEEGVVFLLLTDKVWTDGLDGPQAMAAIVAACPQLSSFQKLGDCVYGMYYLAQ